MAYFADVGRKSFNEFWMNKWSPKSFNDVHVSKKAKLEFKAWLEEACSALSEKAPMLLLVGPPGCGKTTLINCTCKLLNISVIRWEIPQDLEYTDMTAVYYKSQAKKFEEFLATSARYQSVLLGMENNKVIVFEDFPQAFFQNPEKLYEIIKKHYLTSVTPVIFTCDENVEQKLFSQLFMHELKVKHMKIKEMSSRALYTVLSRLKTLYPKVVNVSTEYLKELSKEANGDCRSALLTLYCHIFGVKREEIKSANILDHIRKTTSRSQASTMEKPKQKGRDNDLGVFHLLGQMLYPKRKTTEDSAMLPSMFEHDPNEIAQAAQRYPSIGLLIHENYVSTFGNIEDISAAATYLSEFDIFSNKMEDKENLQKIAFSIVTYGAMCSNNHVVRKWNPWRKSKHSDVVSANKNLRQKMRIQMPRYSTRTTIMELLPTVHSFSLDSSITDNTKFGSQEFSKGS